MPSGTMCNEIALAVHNYESANKRLPPAWTKPAQTGDGWSTQARILPYIEAVSLASAINFADGYGAATIVVDGQAIPVSSYRVPTYLCPSEVNDTLRLSGNSPKHYPLSYGYNAGPWFVYDANNSKVGSGMFTPGKFLRFRDCLDGLANTLGQTAMLKPALVSPKVGNLYFAGQLTLPGPGVPPSLISGQIAACQAIERLERRAR